MAELHKRNSVYPFWGENVNLIKGLDPLGLQVTSEASYATMLTGISNLTNRMRYYGFYCWLLDFFFKKETKGNQTEQNRFIRRAELLIAIIMQSERSNVSQITGSNFALALVNSKPVSFDLVAGADKDSGSKSIYWKYPSGAFGQYYFGALQALSLVIRFENKEGDVLFNVTLPHQRQKVSGKQLADAFDKTLTDEIKTLFYNTIKKGLLYADDIPSLIEFFSIDKINPDTNEWQLYVDMLLDKDYPSMEIEEDFTYHRKETILFLIDTAIQNEDKFDWNIYLNMCYEHKFSESNDTINGWYTYRLNEYWQYACGLIFFGALRNLENLSSEIYLPTFIQNFSNSILSEIGIDKNMKLENYIDSMDLTEENILSQENRNNTPAENAKIGFELLLSIYKNNKQQLPKLKEFMSRNRIIRDGNMADGLLRITSQLQETIADFIYSFIFKSILSRHQIVALRKMGNGTQSTHKFIIEDQMIRLIDIFPAYWTSPRMNALRNLLSDLQIIGDDRKITELHTKIIL